MGLCFKKNWPLISTSAKDTSQRLKEERLHRVWRCSFCFPQDSTRPSTGYYGAQTAKEILGRRRQRPRLVAKIEAEDEVKNPLDLLPIINPGSHPDLAGEAKANMIGSVHCDRGIAPWKRTATIMSFR